MLRSFISFSYFIIFSSRIAIPSSFSLLFQKISTKQSERITTHYFSLFSKYFRIKIIIRPEKTVLREKSANKVRDRILNAILIRAVTSRRRGFSSYPRI